MTKIHDKNLERKTEEYWDKLRRNYRRRVPVWREYALNLLPLEMEGKLLPKPCHTLVLLVGHSIEPLLQSVWTYAPQEVLLILSRHYGEDLTGDNLGQVLRDLLSLLPVEHQVQQGNIHQAVVQPTPADVFRALIEWVRNREDVVIDITGAKKSMVSGAFLYAAYAKVPVSYVDFDDTVYSTKYGRPYGYASHIRSFANPYRTFALRDWERVQRLYTAYHFREARKLLKEEILPVMEEPYFAPEHVSAVDRLVAALHCYELWDAGDYWRARRAKQKVIDQGLDFKPPTAVDLLGDIWPHTADGSEAQEAVDSLLRAYGELTRGRNGSANSIFCRADWLSVYAEDELARINRLIKYNEDYRSALLRAASLNEVLLKARLARLSHDRMLIPVQGQPLVEFDRLVMEATARGMLRVLTGEWQELHIRSGRREQKARLAPGAQTLGSFGDACALDLETIIEVRNKTAHTYLPVPRPISEQARDVTRKNLDDYRDHWAVGSLPNVIVDALAWRELCELCGADVFLPPTLLD